ncbi:hypothetical protein ACA106_16645 [Agrobacterium pusense]|uniref:hypothetical protein n=1 Tax=Agrobacterium pusense TaxID=648995 RepID=UPI0035A58B18
MSMNSEILSSTSGTAIAAASKPDAQLTFTNIPSLGTNPGAADTEKWHETTKACAGDAITFADKKRAATQQTLVMIVMDAQLHTQSYYETKLKEAGLGLPQKKDVLAYAIAWHLKIDVSDTDKKKAADNSKALNRFASAGRRLIGLGRKELGVQRGNIAVTYDANGVAALLNIVVREHGINAMALAGADIDNTKLQPIALSPEALAYRQAKLLEAKLSGESEIVFALARSTEGDELKVTQMLSLPAEAMAHVYPQLKLADPRIRFLAELFAMGEAVVEEKTDHLVNPETDDPNDAYAPRRLASRQYVFHPGGKMIISPILRDTSVVVVVQPKLDLLDLDIKRHIKFQTYGRRRAAANIAGSRQDAFDFAWTDAGDTQGVGRIKLTTPVAKSDDDKTKDVGMLVELVRSKPENFPLTVDPAFVPKVSLGVVPELLDKMDAVSRSAKNLLRNGIPVTIYIEGEKLSFSGYSKAEVVQIRDTRGKGRIDVRPDDFMAVTATLKNVEIEGQFSVAVDPGMLVISFETEFAAYSIHIPTALQGMVRSNRHIVKLDPVVWPAPQDDASAGSNTDTDNLISDESATKA